MDDEPSLDEHISMLESLCADPPPDADLLELTGLLAGAYLERYERDGTGDQLDLAIDGFHTALAQASEHPDLMYWCYHLGIAYGYRARLASHVDDYGHSIYWLYRLHGILPATEPDRDHVALLLMDTYWDRFYFCHYGETPDPATALRLARDVADALGALTVQDEDVASYGKLVLGLAHLASFEESHDMADLAAGVGELAAALDALQSDSPRYFFAASWLMDAHLMRAELDNDPAAVGHSIAIGERMLSIIDADHLDWMALTCFQAAGYQNRWRDNENRDDLDQAIGHWRAAWRQHRHLWPARNCGELLRQRAELSQDAADLAEAVALLDFAAQALTEGDPEAWLVWLELGQAHRLQWTLAQEPGSLDRAAASFDRAQALPLPNDDARLLVHSQRVLAAYDTVSKETSQSHVAPTPEAAQLRRCLAHASADLDRAVTASPDMRAMMATVLAYGEMFLVGLEMSDPDIDRLRDLITRGAQLSDPAEDYQSLITAGFGLVNFAENAANPHTSADAGVNEFVRLAAGESIDQLADLARGWLPAALQLRSLRSEDGRGLQAAKRIPRRADPELDMLKDTLDILHNVKQGGLPDASMVERILTTLDDQPKSMFSERALRPLAHFVRTAASALGGQQTAISPLPDAAPDQPITIYQLFELILAANSALISAIARFDIATMRRCIARLGELAELASAYPTARFVAASLAGLGELELARIDPGDTTAAARSVAWYEELAAGSSPEDPLWKEIAHTLALGMRLSGHPDRARTRQLGMSALRVLGRRVLMQSGTDHAIESARMVSALAYQVAGWCLEDEAHDEAVAVLDAGRGLVLRSTTASRAVADLLVAAGHVELATEWGTSGGLGHDQRTGKPLQIASDPTEVPDDLRRRALRELDAGSDSGSALDRLVSVDVARIRAALASVGADALVYLVPASTSCPGTALIVAASGSIEAISLPGLHTGIGSPIDGHTAFLRSPRDVSPVITSADDRPSQRLDRLCRWAWSAAMGRLVSHTKAWHRPRPARLVLIPMGSLALVPWHAAYVDTPTGRHYAVQDIVFSYSVSAQMFCAGAAHPIQPTRSALVVGNPHGNLPFAGAEALGIHSRFYPHGRYLGQPSAHASGPGSPDDVLEWLASTESGPSTLHFACHATMDMKQPAEAHLDLFGGALAARRLLEASTSAALVIDRVFLAACTTHVTGTDYDEAFSLATAFLAAGAHTVFGSLWPVPDEATSVLMYMVHHHLNVDSCEPADALHRAQLWMLDPAREAPAMMPPSLAQSVPRSQCADPVSWAAFTHLGR